MRDRALVVETLFDLELENVCRDESISNLTNIPSFKDDRQDSQDIINKIEAFIPSNLKFVIKSFRKLTDSGFLLATSPFQAVILINISTSESVSDFIDSYCSTTKETLRCSKSKSQVDPQDVSNHQFIFKKAFRCHHDTRTTKTKWKPDKRSKNTVSICAHYQSSQLELQDKDYMKVLTPVFMVVEMEKA